MQAEQTGLTFLYEPIPPFARQGKEMKNGYSRCSSICWGMRSSLRKEEA
jgi:hypothetical protein